MYRLHMHKKAFTLVELIVVITILAILWTIAFLSFTTYSRDARNTKRLSDLKSIETRLLSSVNAGVSILGAVANNSSTLNGTFTSPLYQGASISWFTGALLNGKYLAGDINYALLGMKSQDFSDPTTRNSYKIWVTILWKSRYELAATTEWNTIAPMLVWNYVPRTDAINNKKASGSADSVKKYIFKLSDVTQTWRLFAWEKTWKGVIQSVSPDGMILTFDTSVDSSWIDIWLAEDEAGWLIRKYDSDWPVVVNSPYSLPKDLVPYILN